MHHYLIEFDFIENGRKCHTAIDGGSFPNEKEAVRYARDWFGFDRDGIEVTKTTVKQLD